MKRISIIAILLCLTILIFQTVESISETFLVIYRQIFSRPVRNIALTYLMKLDATGRIIMRPQKIAPELNHSFGFSFGLSWNRPGINLWTIGINPNFPPYPLYVTKRLTMNRHNFATMSIEPIRVKGAGLSFLSVTDKSDRNFILFGDNKEVVIGVGLSLDGTKTGEIWRLSRTGEEAYGAVVSGDGRMAAWVSPDGLVIQRLHENGRPSRVRNVLKLNGWGIGSLAITNVLPGNKRYVLISAWDYSGNGSCSGARNRILLLTIEDLTAKRIDKGLDFRFDVGCDGTQRIQMDPKGRFFLYAVPGFNIYFQSLDADGRRIGKAKLVAENADPGFAMLPN